MPRTLKHPVLIFAISRAEENMGKIGFFKTPTVSVGVDHVVSGGGVVVVLIDVVARERVVVGLQVSVIEDHLYFAITGNYRLRIILLQRS